MNELEKQLFLHLCAFESDFLDHSLVESASPGVLGYLFYHRMYGVAFGRLKELDLLRNTNREFRNSLKMGYEKNLEKNNSFFDCLKTISILLNGAQQNVAFLKGAVLCQVFPPGYRVCNDIDILTIPSGVSSVSELLYENGFKQGRIINNTFVQASRFEIIHSKMMRGETVPFVKEVGLPGMQFLEIDVNYSFDYKNGNDNSVQRFLERRINLEIIDGVSIPTFEKVDFFIHLCCHLYKEATTLPWVKMGRDMTLYKYVDIYYLLNRMSPSEVDEVYKRANEEQLSDICSFAIIQTANLFGLQSIYANERIENVDLLHRVISPRDGTVYIYRNKSIIERLFLENRMNDLEKV